MIGARGAAASAAPSPDLARPWRGAVARGRALLLGPAVPALVAAAGLAACLAVPLSRYLSYRSPAYDLGFFDQVVERTAQGHPFQTSLLGYTFLGEHFEPVLAIWAPLDRLAASPVWLLAIQALALAAAPVAAWRLARAWLGVSWAAPLAALACLLDPLVGRAAAFDYHSEALTPVLALLALDGAARGHRWRLWLPALALLLVKEDAILVAAGVGWIAWRADRRRAGLALCAVMLVAFAAVVGVAMPLLRGGAAGDLASRYAYLGGTSPAAMLGGALLHPERWLARLAAASARRGLGSALLPLGGLPLLGGSAALAAAPVLLVALLSASPYQAELRLHYGLEVFPLLLAGALLGWRRLTVMAPRRLPRRGRRPAGLLIAALAAGSAATSPLLPGRAAVALGGDRDRSAAVGALLARIPAAAPVSASSGLVAHLSAREQVYEFPDRAFEEPFVVLDDAGPRASWTVAAGYDAAAAGLGAHGYRRLADVDGVTLWAR